MNNYSLIKSNTILKTSSSDIKYKIFILNLKKRLDRKNNVIQQFKSANFSEVYNFYEAIDASNIEEDIEMATLFKVNDFACRKGFIGCALSHYNMWIDLLKDPINDYYVIFEDDITLCKDFSTYFNNAKDVMQNFVKKIDILFLGYHDSIKMTDNQNMIDLIPFNQTKYIGGFFSYIITKKGAQNMLNYIETNGICHGIDYLIKIITDKNISIYELHPHIVYSDWVQGGNNIDSNIQRDISVFNLKKVNTDYYNETTIKKIHVKMLCNWQSGHDLCEEWNPMSHGNKTWNNIKIIDNDNNPDYYVIVNMPHSNLDLYNPSKTIVFQMEPMCTNTNQTWGVKTWGEWTNPDESKFLQVRNHKNYYNNCSWQLKRTYNEFQMDIDKDIQKENGKEIIDQSNNIFKYYNYFSTICSSKYHDPGHKLRIDFLKYIENIQNTNDTQSKPLKIDIYGHDNKFLFKNYIKSLDNNSKEDGLIPYKYYFIAENNREHNYISEKLWEPILCECLCFYWGAPNVSNYINPDAFVQLDLNDFEGSFNIMKQAILEDWYSKKINIIKREKNKILNYYNFFPTIERIILQDIYKDTLNTISKKISINQLSNNTSHRIEPFIDTLKNMGFVVNSINNLLNNKNIKIENINGKPNEKRLLFLNDIKYYINSDDITKDNIKILLKNYEQIKLFEDIINNKNTNNKNIYDNHLIISDNYKNTCYLDTFLKYIDYKNLPEDYDVCQLTNSINTKFKVTYQKNHYYFKVKKYFFDNCGVYIISKNGMLKILRFLNNYIPNNEDFMYECYENIEGFNFYSIGENNSLFSLLK